MTLSDASDGPDRQVQALARFLDEPGIGPESAHYGFAELFDYATERNRPEIEGELREHIASCESCASLVESACELWFRARTQARIDTIGPTLAATRSVPLSASTPATFDDAAPSRGTLGEYGVSQRPGKAPEGSGPTSATSTDPIGDAELPGRDLADDLFNAALGADALAAAVACEIIENAAALAPTEQQWDRLLAALSPDSPDILPAAELAAALGQRAGPAVAAAVQRLLLADDPLRRVAAAETAAHLGVIAAAGTRAALLDSLRPGKPTWLRAAAVKALGALASADPDPTATAAGLAASLADSAPDLRGLACDALARLGARSAGAVKAVAARLSDPDPAIRQTTQRAFGSMLSGVADAATANLSAWPRLLARALVPEPIDACFARAASLGQSAGPAPPAPSHFLWGTVSRRRPGDLFALDVQLPDSARRQIEAGMPLHIAVLWSDGSGLYCIAPREGYEASCELAPDGRLRLPRATWCAVGSGVGPASVLLLLAVGHRDPFDGIHTGLATAELAEQMSRLDKALTETDDVPWWRAIVFALEIEGPSP
ncbi:MAG: hypothetical protein WAU78_05970 [Roseiarcus sp.]